MEDKAISAGYASNPNALKALQLTKISLLIFLLGICLVGRQESTWPIVSWILYSGYSERYRSPKPFVSAVELRAYNATGKLHIVKPEQLLSIPYDSLSHSIVEQAFDDADADLRDASRRYLMRAVSNLIRANSEIKTIQAWKLTYAVEPLAVPPIQRQVPTAEVMLGSFSEENLIESN